MYAVHFHSRELGEPVDTLLLAASVTLEGVIGVIGSAVARHRRRIDWVDVVLDRKRLRFMVDHTPNAANLPIIRAV